MTAPQTVRAEALIARLEDAAQELTKSVAELRADPTLVDSVRWVEYTEQAPYYVSSLVGEFCGDDAYYDPDDD